MKEKVTLVFTNGGTLVFKCKSFKINKSNGRFTSAEWDNVRGMGISFKIEEVVGVTIKKVLF